VATFLAENTQPFVSPQESKKEGGNIRYKKLNEALEAICELNHQFLRPDATASKRGGKRRD
jgi:hypothetical protein